MIRIHVDESTLARTRIAISPLNEVVAGLYLLHREPERVPWPYTGWAVRAREVLRTVPLTAPLRLYADLYGEEHTRPTPDVFSPVPPSPRPSLADELAVLRRTPQALVAQQFAKHCPHGVPRVPGSLRPGAGSGVEPARRRHRDVLGSRFRPGTGRRCARR